MSEKRKISDDSHSNNSVAVAVAERTLHNFKVILRTNNSYYYRIMSIAVSVPFKNDKEMKTNEWLRKKIERATKKHTAQSAKNEQSSNFCVSFC